MKVLQAVSSVRFSLVLRGDKDERAVLCTDNQTFNLQVAEISNSLALVPDLVWPGDANGISQERCIESKQVCHNIAPDTLTQLLISPSFFQVEKIFFEYFEAQLTSPRITKLMSLLEPSCYKGPNYEETYKQNGVEFKSTRDLLMRVQASEAELLQGLKENCVCFLNGDYPFS